jgi:hypothetical protein
MPKPLGIYRPEHLIARLRIIAIHVKDWDSGWL